MANLELFSWDDSYNVGIQEVDEQHKVLVSLLNQLHTAIVEHHGKTTSREILERGRREEIDVLDAELLKRAVLDLRESEKVGHFAKEEAGGPQ